MIIYIPEESLADCKELVQKFMKTSSDFKEIGGYLIGIYNGDFEVREFLLDKNAESTTTRIKLSAECFQQVEERLTETPDLLYIGTWHVHPGKSKPMYSPTDQSTLFLEKLVIETDNPKEFNCPRIHLIFSEDLKQISAFAMHVILEYQLTDYWTLEKQIDDSDIDRIGDIIEKLSVIKKDFQHYKKGKKIEVLESCFSELSYIRGDIDKLIDLIEDISDFQEIFLIINKERRNIEKQLKFLIKKGETLGIFTLTEDDKITFIHYRPHLIKENLDDGTLLGFWRHYSIVQPPIELQEIFFANFFRKIEANSNNSFIYVMSDPSGIKFYSLKISEFTGISFEDVKIAQEEED